jgi:hypothetical protein
VDIKKAVAPRFTLKLPMRYRPVGESRCRETKTINVSASGAVFLASEVLLPDCQLEIQIWMKARLLTPGTVLTTSEVVRQSSESLVTVVRHLQYEMRSEDNSNFGPDGQS